MCIQSKLFQNHGSEVGRSGGVQLIKLVEQNGRRPISMCDNIILSRAVLDGDGRPNCSRFGSLGVNRSWHQIADGGDVLADPLCADRFPKIAGVSNKWPICDGCILWVCDIDLVRANTPQILVERLDWAYQWVVDVLDRRVTTDSATTSGLFGDQDGQYRVGILKEETIVGQIDAVNVVGSQKPTGA